LGVVPLRTLKAREIPTRVKISHSARLACPLARFSIARPRLAARTIVRTLYLYRLANQALVVSHGNLREVLAWCALLTVGLSDLVGVLSSLARDTRI
jgi:hypothetical protein